MKGRSPATVISVLALFFSLGGVSLAASRYLITSTSQIKPSVRAALRGPKGKSGANGARGATGSTGVSGINGAPGATGPTGPAGTAQAYAVVASNGALVHGAGYPKNITSVVHNANSGIYCLVVTSGIDASAAVVSQNDDSFVGSFVFKDASPTDCTGPATGTFVEVETGVLVVGSATTQGSPLDAEAADGGFTIVVP